LDAIEPATTICTEYAIETSLQGVVQSSTLLKNVKQRLPFHAPSAADANGGGGVQFAVIGPNANYSQGDAGYYGPRNVCGHNFWNAVDAVAKYATAVIFPGRCELVEVAIPPRFGPNWM
jgi:hypothetical protein